MKEEKNKTKKQKQDRLLKNYVKKKTRMDKLLYFTIYTQYSIFIRKLSNEN